MVSTEDIDQVTNAIKETRTTNKHLDNEAVADHIYTTRRNKDRSHINKIAKTILEKHNPGFSRSG